MTSKRQVKPSTEILRFCALYVAQAKSDPAGAWLQAFPHSARDKGDKIYPKRKAADLLKRKDVQAEIERLMEPVTIAARLSAKSVVERFARIAFADPRELSSVRYVNCRHCWGVGHEYQWTPNEAARTLARAVDAKLKVKPTFPGGTNFKPTRPPHPDCPECGGEGEAEVRLADTSKLTIDGQALYAGAKHGKYGIEVMTHNQMDALKALGQFFGVTPETVRIMFEDAATANPVPGIPMGDPMTAARVYNDFMSKS